MLVAIAANSLVIFKNRPGRVIGNVDKKIDVLFADGKTIKLPEKNLLLLHQGDFKDFDELTDIGEGELHETWLLLQNQVTSYQELSELIFGSLTPNHVYAVWKIVEQGVYFTVSRDGISVNTAQTVKEIKKAAEEKLQKAQAFEAFVARLKEKSYCLEDAPFIKEIVNFALGLSSSCRFFKFLNLEQTMQNAHALLLDIGFWGHAVNPYPARFSVPIQPPDESVSALPEQQRIDLSYMPSFAIDDKDSNDPDDAISFDEKTQKLWVHVADPAALVEPDSQIDKTARMRGCNLYLPESVVPMLPQEITDRLALGLQSLCPALSIGFYVLDDGTIDDVEICLSNISVTRLSYDQAEKKLAETPLLQFKQNAERFYKFRKAHGAIELYFPEVKVTLKSSAKVEITQLAILESRNLVRNAMLMAGVAVAKFAKNHNIPMPFSTQAPHELSEEAQNPKTLSEMFNVRKSLQKSQYKTAVAPHTGMGLPYYIQVTSPLRRYLDLVVHQQLRAFLNKQTLLSEIDIAERIAEVESVNQSARQAMRFSDMHWKCVYLLQNKDFQGDGIVVEKLQGNRVSVFIPQLALIKKLTLSMAVELDQRISLKLSQVKLASQDIYFLPTVQQAV